MAGTLSKVRVISGSASEADILHECGIEAADAFVAVSASDHSNLVSAVLAKKMGAKFSFGSNNFNDQPIDMSRCFEAIERFGLTKDDVHVPAPRR